MTFAFSNLLTTWQHVDQLIWGNHIRTIPKEMQQEQVYQSTQCEYTQIRYGTMFGQLQKQNENYLTSP